MIITLEYPFTELYNAGYTHVSNEGRKLITLKKFNGEFVLTNGRKIVEEIKQ